MAFSWSNIFKSREKIEAEIRESIRLEEERAAAEVERVKREAEAERIQKHLSSDIPWIEPIPEAVDAPLVSDRYRWNAAFIRDLVRKGIKGDTEAQIITNYFVDLEEAERLRVIEEEREKLRNSDEPWVEVVSEDIDPDNGRISLKIDWNDAFIKYLRENGITGGTDEQIVHKWLAMIERDRNPEEYH